jgi:hypothetical protein
MRMATGFTRSGWNPGAARDQELKDELVERIAGLGEALAGDRARAARLLLHWAANAANFAVNSAMEQRTSPRIQTASAGEMYYDCFLPREGAGYCSAMSMFYERLLTAFGYEAMTVAFGDAHDGLTHAFVNVRIPESGPRTGYIFDPTFNATFRDAVTGRHLGYFDLVDAGESDEVAVVAEAGSIEARAWLSVGPIFIEDCALREVIGDRFVYSRRGGTFADYLQCWAPVLAARGYEAGMRGFVQLMKTRVFHFGFSDGPPAGHEFLEGLALRGIPFGME